MLVGDAFKDKMRKMRNLKQLINTSTIIDNKKNANSIIPGKTYLDDNDLLFSNSLAMSVKNSRKFNLMKLSGKKEKKRMANRNNFYEDHGTLQFFNNIQSREEIYNKTKVINKIDIFNEEQNLLTLSKDIKQQNKIKIHKRIKERDRKKGNINIYISNTQNNYLNRKSSKKSRNKNNIKDYFNAFSNKKDDNNSLFVNTDLNSQEKNILSCNYSNNIKAINVPSIIQTDTLCKVINKTEQSEEIYIKPKTRTISLKSFAFSQKNKQVQEEEKDDEIFTKIEKRVSNMHNSKKRHQTTE